MQEPNTWRFTLLLSIAAGIVMLAGCSDGSGSNVLGTPADVEVDPGGTADYVSIQAAIDGSAPGSVIRVRSGTFQEQLTLAKGVHIIGSGPGTVIQLSGTATAFPDESSDSSTAVLTIRNTGGVIVENLRFSGPQDGVQIRNSSDVTLRGIDASGNGDDGVDVRNSSDVRISGTFVGNGDKGVQIRESSSRVSIENSTVAENRGNGIRIRESSTSFVQGSSVSRNVDDGIEVRDASGVAIRDNTITDNVEYGIRIRNAPDTMLQNNALSGNVEGDVRQE